MRLRSGRSRTRETAKTDSSLENGDASYGKKLCLNSGKSVSSSVSESLLDRVVDNGASKAVDMVCLDNAAAAAAADLQIGCNDKRNSVILKGTEDGGDTDGKGMSLGSEVVDSVKDSVSCPEIEIKEERVEHVQIECSVDHINVGVEAGKESVPISLNDMDPGVEEVTKSPSDMPIDTYDASAPSPIKEAEDLKSGSECVESGKVAEDDGEIKIVSCDEDKKSSAAVLDESLLLNVLNDSEKADASISEINQPKGKGRRGRKRKNAGSLKNDEINSHADMTQKEINVKEPNGSLHEECQKEVNIHAKEVDESGKNTLTLEKRKRGRKRKNVDSSECNGDDKTKNEKVRKGGILVSQRVLRPRTTTMSDTHGGSVKVGDSNVNVAGLKRKIETESLHQTEIKIETECLHQTELQTVEEKSTRLTDRPQKKLKRRGRPPKVQGDTIPLHGMHEVVASRNLKRRGRPPKVQGKELVSPGMQKNKHKDMVPKKIKRLGRPPKMQARNLAAHVVKINKLKRMTSKKKVANVHKMQNGVPKLYRDNGQNVKRSEESNDQAMSGTTVEGRNMGMAMKKLKKGQASGGGAERRKEQQLVRDQIVSIIKKAGWTIEYRPRLNREYLDAVYVDQNGRTHWSVTKAYSTLKKKIDDGVADSKEVSAFTPIPEEAMSTLFRHVKKTRSDKNMKKKNKKGTEASKAGINASPWKKSGKKSKDGSKRKEIQDSAIRSGKGSPDMKVRGDKSCHQHHIMTGSSCRGRPKLSQEGRQSRKPLLLARSSEKLSDKDKYGFTKYNGKRNLLSWMIGLGVVLLGGKVHYGKGRRKKRSFEGTITSDGIHCGCCNEIMGLSDFVSHAGGELSQIFSNVYLESGTSLLECLLASWRKEEESSSIKFNLVDVNGGDPNDDTCNICGDGGDLICCDGCPSTFHQSCLDIQNFPSGDWHCIYCSCKFCGMVDGNASQKDESNDAVIPEMLSCSLCEEKFHQLCIQPEDSVNMDSGSLSFCGRKCHEVFERLQGYVGVKFELEGGYSWTLLQRDVSPDSILHDAPPTVECNSKLAVAFAVMDECFVPIVDERSGINMIHNVVYNCGSNFRRLNYAGFFTAILERGDELIAAASIRIHGHRLAEMPFIGTRHMYRRQGMCRRLLNAIESALCSIGVGELVIPAIPELLQTWTQVFGFKPLEASKRKTMKCMSMIVFPFTDMLQKSLLKNQTADGNLNPASVVECNTKLTDESVSQSETKLSNAIDNKQRHDDAAGEGEDAIGSEQIEEVTVFKDGCSYPHEDSAHLKTEISVNSHGVNSVCDLELSEKNVTCQVPEATGEMTSNMKLDFPRQHDSSGSDPQPPDDSVAHEPIVVLVTSEQVPFPYCTTRPSSMVSVTCGRESPKLQSLAENNGIGAVQSSSLASVVAPKNAFDLNLHPSAADTDICEDSHSFGPQVGTKSFELSESRSQVENSAVSLRDAEPCATQPLVLV